MKTITVSKLIIKLEFHNFNCAILISIVLSTFWLGGVLLQ